ncbi:sigma factor-like helix-turn-helix DNA-binding protein [Algibacter lectus]|nr:sigma factor-like helix-turn-helix DNA-binding protein [Algibacter lectus]
MDGLSNQEVCDITEKSLSSVESLMFRAKKNLQDVLGDFYKNDMK